MAELSDTSEPLSTGCAWGVKDRGSARQELRGIQPASAPT